MDVGWMCKSLDLTTSCCPRLFFSFPFHLPLYLSVSGVDWVLLDSCYLRDGDLSGWRDFLTDLGVRDLLIFRKERRTLRDTELVRGPTCLACQGVIPCVPGPSMLLNVLRQPNEVVQQSKDVAT